MGSFLETDMSTLDLVLRNARPATASDVFDCDIGIAGGRIVALAQGLPRAPREVLVRFALEDYAATDWGADRWGPPAPTPATIRTSP